MQVIQSAREYKYQGLQFDVPFLTKRLQCELKRQDQQLALYVPWDQSVAETNWINV